MLGPGVCGCVWMSTSSFCLQFRFYFYYQWRVFCARENTTATTKQTTIGGVVMCVCVCAPCVCVCVCVVLFLLVWRGVAPAPPRVFVDTLTSMSPLYPSRSRLVCVCVPKSLALFIRRH
jgi:hypothetical protein